MMLNPGSVKKLKDGEREAYKKRTGQDVPVSKKKQKKQDAEQQRLLALANVNIPSEPPPVPPPAAAGAAPKAKAKAAEPKAKAKAAAEPKAKAVPIKQVGVEKDDNRTKAYWKGQNLAYIKTQYELHGGKISPSCFTGRAE